MCGITGFYSPHHPTAAEVCGRMTDSLQHRGPDDTGVWQDGEAGIKIEVKVRRAPAHEYKGHKNACCPGC